MIEWFEDLSALTPGKAIALVANLDEAVFVDAYGHRSLTSTVIDGVLNQIGQRPF